ncbi:Hypothetical protein A7982_06197 [Minicystis rosea]|nr:Hypothetical protein A7982_06197 [Minicystis rosea]
MSAPSTARLALWRRPLRRGPVKRFGAARSLLPEPDTTP